jgi:mono/diheme cytochrome c family protein
MVGVVLATTTTTIAVIGLTVIVVGWIAYLLRNLLHGRREVGSEIELAPNRKPYYDDETLEGPRLERLQLMGVLMLVVIVIGLPLYWMFEPSRQAGAEEGWDNRFASWGSELFAPTAEGGYNCAGCHGGMNATGGVAPFTVTDPQTGEVQSVSWKAPALDTIFYRFSDDEVRFILNYGRPFSPMSPWGLVGGGPLNEQQIDTLLAYMHSIQIPRENCLEGEDPRSCDSGNLPAEIQDDIDVLARQAVEEGRAESYGEALFNLDLASGAYSCARCHTIGWSYDQPGVSGQGAFGWNLTGGAVNRHFANQEQLINFIRSGSENGKLYGLNGQGSGRMPGFGAMLTDEQITAIVEYVESL